MPRQQKQLNPSASSLYASPVAYPYTPAGKSYAYVSLRHPFMRQAKLHGKTLRKQAPGAIVTSAVVVKNDKVLGKGVNNPVHGSFCPRTVFQSPSGQNYELCPRHCHSDNHAEAQALKNAARSRVTTKGGDLYLYGHWWCCQPCWDAMIKAGIRQVYLAKGATQAFSMPVSVKGELKRPLDYYFAAGLTRLEHIELKKFYEEVMHLLERVKLNGYLPHLYSDPIKNPAMTPHQVYERNAGNIKAADFVLAYMGEPSLGVGIELELARKYRKPVIAFAPQATRVSRMALGAPAVASFFFFTDIKNMVIQLSQHLEDLIPRFS